MKILYLLFKIGPYHHTRFKYIAKQYDLTVVEVFPTSREYDWNDIDTEGIYKVVRLNNEEENELKGRKLLENINKLICAISPDVVVTMGWSIKTYFAALKVAKSYNIPVCCLSDSTKDDYRRYWIIENLKSSFVKSFDSFLVAGKRSKQYLNNL